MEAYSSFQVKRFDVFPSFHGPDVRRGFLSHLHSLFARKGITMFKDQEIERGHTIGSELVQAIREARVSIVLLSKNYASSRWCLDELVEILKCREDQGQIVMPIFYEVEPSHVRKQKGDFGRAFRKTCEGETEKNKWRWIKALADVAIIAGEHTSNWTDEAAMVEKFAKDVSKKLNYAALSRYTEENMKKIFRSFDKNQNGFISAAEFRHEMTNRGQKGTEEEVIEMIQEADVNGDGQISYDEFVKIMMANKADEAAMMDIDPEKEMKKVFRRFDKDQNGFISATELRHGITDFGGKLTDEEAKKMIQGADVDGDGEINYDEFVKLMNREVDVDENGQINYDEFVKQ